MIQAVIFDMDGVIVDSEPYQFLAFQDLFQEYGVKLTRENFNGVGRTAKENIELLMKKWRIQGDLLQLSEKREEIYRRLIKNNVKPMKGAIRLINRLGFSCKLAVASSSIRKNIDFILTSLKLKGKFDAVVGGDEVKNGKPAPDIFIAAAAKLKVKPSACVVIEDAERGVAAAKAAKMFCIAVPNKYTLGHNFSEADLVVSSLEEINSETIKKLH